ncbi:MAG: pseudouridine synthase [Clostridiales bacterium]|nr:pseudouridine synthase [Clostridiales bacterium]
MEKRRSGCESSQNEPVRLNKYLSDVGICSRRQADRYVEEGRITVDGCLAELGQKVTPDQKICLDGKAISGGTGVNHRRILLVVNKPKGIVCTTQKKDPDNIVDFIGYPERIYPVGRLDKDSEGLILMTNDGELMDEILRARNRHEKEYEVRVNKPVGDRFLKAMVSGVPILDTVTRPCKVRKTGTFTFRIILTQGLNRQIRRMCEALDYRVVGLRRIRVMNIRLGDLPVGSYREVTPEELFEIDRLTGRGTSWKSKNV